MAGEQVQAPFDQPATGQLLIAVGPAHMAVRYRHDVGNAYRGHRIQQPQVLHAQGDLQIVQFQVRTLTHQLVQPADKGPRCCRPPGKSIDIQLDAQQLRSAGVRLFQCLAQRLFNQLELFVKHTGTVGLAVYELQPGQRAHGPDRRLQARVVQSRLTQGAAQGIDQHQQAPVDPLFAVPGAGQAQGGVIQVAHLGKRRPHAGHVVLEVLAIAGACRIEQAPGYVTVRGTTGMPVTDRGTKQPRDIGRVRRTGLVQIVVEVIAGAVEEQADMQGLATRRRNPVTGRQAQSILIAPFLLALAQDILLHLFDTAR